MRTPNRDQLILVNEKDEWQGHMPKLAAHEQGLRHRAFSVFIFNGESAMLLQQRAPGKYHSGSLWTNACCSHPAPGESTLAAAHRRLKEEMGFDTRLEKAGVLPYRAAVGNNLTEHEIDHLYTGMYDGAVHPDAEEAMAYRWQQMDLIEKDLARHPEQFTAWFHLAFPIIRAVAMQPV